MHITQEQPADAHSGSTQPIDLTLKQAQQVINVHFDPSYIISSLEESRDDGYSYSPTTKSYLLHVSAPTDDNLTYLLLLSHPNPPPSPAPILPLELLQVLHNLIATQTSIPIPALHTFSTSLDVLPYYYALFAHPYVPGPNVMTLAHARDQGRLSEVDDVRLDLQLGVYLKQLHAIQNDWFGVPEASAAAPTSSLLSSAFTFDEHALTWQEAFTPLLEKIIDALEPTYPELADARLYLSRAIGFFLFDDVEVPSLVSVTGGAEDVWLSVPPGSEPSIVFLHPRILTHVIWGDTLLALLLLPPGPSQALCEAYTDGPLTIFPRQQTKRVWYVLFVACLVLLNGGAKSEKGPWALEKLRECVVKLKDAPYY
ncbi:hypothetical protein PLICRDRAFT_175453 [Plicaturopsis crispa FD-325 SS-3]|nr:hypothetical protein PLICRDRAFT_175453 [Plicaturopsis crispa FD-325 SS-3]